MRAENPYPLMTGGSMSMPLDLAPRLDLSRRAFLQLVGATASAATAPIWLGGCASDPVTGRSTLVGLDERQEVAIDRQYAPQQFSSDFGASQDDALTATSPQSGRASGPARTARRCPTRCAP